MRIIKDTPSTESGVIFEGSNEPINENVSPVPTGTKLTTTTGLNIEQVQYVKTHFDLTQEIKDELKELYGKSLKKISLMSHDFVFRIFSREEWETEIDEWRTTQEKSLNRLLSDEEIDRQLIEVALAFPTVCNLKRYNAEFNFPIELTTYLNSLPAGIQPKLARYIEHYSGFFISELVKDTDELFAEDIFDGYEATERPSDDELAKVKSLTDLPIRLVRACSEWFAIRALKWSELKAMRQKSSEGVDGDYEVKVLQKTILVGPKNFDDMPAGLVPFLFVHLKQISGLDTEGADVFETEAEDL